MMLLLTDRTAGAFVLADWMVIDVLDLLTALAVCVPEDSSIVVPFVSCVELYAAPSVEHGDDDAPHDVAVDPPVVFTYNAFAGMSPPPPPVSEGHVVPERSKDDRLVVGAYEDEVEKVHVYVLLL